MIVTILFNIAGEERSRVTPIDPLDEKYGGNKLYLIDKMKDAPWINIAAEFANGLIVPVTGVKGFDQLRDQLNMRGMTLEEFLTDHVKKGIEETRELRRRYPHGHYAKAAGLFDELKAARAIWDEDRRRKAEEKEIIEAKKKAALEEEQRERLELMTERCRQGLSIGAEAFKELARFHGLWMSPRTLGWINNCLVDIDARSFRWCPAKRGQRQSDAVLTYYRELQALCEEHVSKKVEAA